jgi:hypothetical protein
MATDLTDISGIGKKTAESLRESGIGSKRELLERFEAGDPAVVDELNSRALSGIREQLFEQRESFKEPTLGVTVRQENRQAVEKLGLRTLGDLGSIDVTQEKANEGLEVSADTRLGELAPQAVSGELGEKDASDSLVGFASDTAANLGMSDLGSGELQTLNRIKRADDPAETTAPRSASRNSSFPDDVDEQFSLRPSETAKAQAVHEERSPEARSVDARRRADLTDDFDEWAADPRRHDFPGVDTPSAVDEFFATKRVSNAAGFGSTKRENRDDNQLRRGLERIQRADEKVQEAAIGRSVDFSLSGLFSDSEDDNNDTMSLL